MSDCYKLNISVSVKARYRFIFRCLIRCKKKWVFLLKKDYESAFLKTNPDSCADEKSQIIFKVRCKMSESACFVLFFVFLLLFLTASLFVVGHSLTH